MPLNLQELRELLADLNQSDISEFSLKTDDFELTVRRGTTVNTVHVVSAPPEIVAAPAISPTSVPIAAIESAPTPTAAPAVPVVDPTLVDIISPMVGTFYRAPGPDEAPFVDIKDRIRVGQTVCIIEAMKLMNEIEAETAGEVVDILIQNGQAVEYGQVLMRVRAS